jgi:hypothetical protein
MDFDKEFEKIRPYNDSEVKQGIDKLISLKEFTQVSKYLFPDVEIERVIGFLKKIDTINDFQKIISSRFLQGIVKSTITEISSTGVDSVKNEGHLFIANHRDIVLDAALMQAILLNKDIPTTEITVGDNLTANPFFKEMGKLNKMFTLYRGGGKIQMYKNAILHSKYIHRLVRERNTSLWIAQRDGRTKDGNDKTQQGLLKMLLGDRRDIIPAIKELDIVPVSTSYELEPCFKEKINELYISKYKEYVKEENEDMNSIVTGMFGQKGRVHIAFGTPINDTIKDIDDKELTNNEIIEIFINEIDKQIYNNYKLWPNNYIAWDILNNTNKYKDKYTKAEKATFESYIDKTIKEIEGNKSEILEIALGIYANPINNSNLSK